MGKTPRRILACNSERRNYRDVTSAIWLCMWDTCAQTQNSIMITSACKFQNLNVMKTYVVLKNWKTSLSFFLSSECNNHSTDINSHCKLFRLTNTIFYSVFFPLHLKKSSSTRILRARDDLYLFYFFLYSNKTKCQVVTFYFRDY